MRRIVVAASVSAFCCLTLLGCGQKGPATAPVSGRVTLDGEPVTDALVTFLPEGGGTAATGQTNASGEYELICLGDKGAVIGKHTVKVTTIQSSTAAAEAASSDSEEYQKMMSDPAAYEAASAGQKFEEKIPQKYNLKSELVKEVTSGSNVIDLELTSE